MLSVVTCHLPGVRSAAAAPISLCAPLFHSGLRTAYSPWGEGWAGQPNNRYLSEFIGAQVSLLFLVLYCLCTVTPHCVRTYAFPCPPMPPVVTHPLGYASVSEEWRRPA